MEKIIRKYGILIAFYIIMFGGVIILSNRVKYLESINNTSNNTNVYINK